MMKNQKVYLILGILILWTNIGFCQQSSGNDQILSPGIPSSTQSDFRLILESLKKNYDVDFALDPSLKAEKFNSTYDLNQSLEKSLKDLFIHSNIDFRISGSLVLLRDKSLVDNHSLFQGFIKDVRSGEGLPYVSITDKASINFFTDSSGYFILNIPDNQIPDSLFLSYVGYAELGLKFEKSKSLLDIQMHSRTNKIPVININSVISKTGSLYYTNLKEIEKLSFSSGIAGNDLFRAIQLQSGISSVNDLSSQIRIRGSEAYETMIELDGMVIYNPTHFYNFFSAINDDFVHKTEIFQNNLPIEFSGRTGGLVKLESKDLRTPKFELYSDIDLLNAALLVELPISKNIGLLLSGRSAYSDLSQTSFFKTLSFNNRSDIDNLSSESEFVRTLKPDFNYYDFNAKLQANLSKNRKLKLNFYSSTDKLNNRFKTEENPSKYIKAYLFDYADLSSWKNIGISGSFLFPASKSQNELTFNYSMSEFHEDFSFYNYLLRTSGEKEFLYKNELSNEIHDFHLKWLGQRRLGEKINYSYGIEVANYTTSSLINTDSILILEEKRSESPLSFFQEFKRQYEQWNIQLGLRLSYLMNSSKILADPRVSFIYKLKNNAGNLYNSFSINHQYLFQYDYENHLGQSYSFWTIANEQSPVLTSYNINFGYKIEKEKFKFITELYYKKRNNISEFAITKPGIYNQNEGLENNEGFRLFTGDGTILGIDFSLSKKFKNYESQVNYTLSSNMVQFENIFNGKAFPDRDHRTHQLKWLNNYYYKDFTFNVNTLFSSGKPYFYISNLNKDIPRKELIRSEQIRYLPYYFRLDAGILFKTKVFTNTIEIGVSVFNITNRQNVYNAQYIQPIQLNGANSKQFAAVGYENELLDRTLNLSFSLQL